MEDLSLAQKKMLDIIEKLYQVKHPGASDYFRIYKTIFGKEPPQEWLAEKQLPITS